MIASFLSSLLALSLAAAAVAAPAPSSGLAIQGLLDALASPSAVFDGSRPAPAAVYAVPGGRVRGKAAGSLSAPARPAASAPAAAAPAAEPSSAQGVSDGYIGLYPEDDFVLGTGRCESCRAPLEGKWYFLDDVIATPKSGPPALVWIGARELVTGARLSDDGRSVRLQDGTVLPFELVGQISSNRSYYDASSRDYFRGRSLRIRGEYVEKDGRRTLVARTIWPEDYRIDAAGLQAVDVKNAADIDALVAADRGGSQGPFQTRLLWEREGAGRAWEGRPVMGFMINGAQGDDDEALAGHFSMFTGRYGEGGSMADWMFDNFYGMNTVSEKGIVASMVPMDKYMTDLNSGQSWYRPSYVLVMVMKDDRLPLVFQEKFKERYAQYYSQAIKYDKTNMNCTALIADPVREAGWKYPETGRTPALLARLISGAVGLAAHDPEVGEQIYQSLREEPTRSFPRASFISAGGDVLSLVRAWQADPISRELSPVERQLQEDLLAVLFVRLPQIPSSRQFGREPVSSVTDYFMRAPADRSKWQTVPSVPRPFPPPR